MLLNLRILASTFLMIFLAELGDKTQISIFALAANRKAFLSVFIGAAGAVFVGFGALTLYEAFKT